eukprot:sb/3468642/
MLVASKTGVHPRQQEGVQRVVTDAAHIANRHVKFTESEDVHQPPPKPKRREHGKERLQRGSNVSNEAPKVNLSNFLNDQEEEYFCKLDGIVKLMKDKPEDHGLQEKLERVRKENFKRSQYGITSVDPGRNREDEEKMKRTLREKKKREELEKKRKEQIEVKDKGRDTFSFQDLIESTHPETKQQRYVLSAITCRSSVCPAFVLYHVSIAHGINQVSFTCFEFSCLLPLFVTLPPNTHTIYYLDLLLHRRVLLF